MPQTTNAVPQSCARVDISTAEACTPWTNVSGSVNSVTGTTQTKVVADEYTFDGPGAISEVGKVEPVDLTFRVVFTNVATEAYRLARSVFNQDCAGKLCVRWILSGAVGGDGFQTGYVSLTSFQWGDADSSSGGPAMIEFIVHAGTIDPFVFVS